MPTSSAVLPTDPVVDAKLAKRFVMACGAVPLLLLAWDAQHHQLGVNSANFAIRTTGLVGLLLLSLSLVITPLRRLTGATWLVAARRNLGVLERRGEPSPTFGRAQSGPSAGDRGCGAAVS